MKKDILEYWIGILKKAWNQTKDKLGIAGIIFDFFLAICGTLIYHYFLSDNEYNLGEIFVGFAVFLGVILLVFFYYILIVSAKQDAEQKAIIVKNAVLDLRVGMGEDDNQDMSEIYLEFHSFYEDVDITEMFVQINQFSVSKFPREVFFKAIKQLERKKIFAENKYVGKTLKWKTIQGFMERITLKPNETARVLFLENFCESDVLHFAFDTVSVNESLKNDWQKDGIYEVLVDVYGRVGKEHNYKKQTFIVLVEFVKGKSTEVFGSIVADIYEKRNGI